MIQGMAITLPRYREVVLVLAGATSNCASMQFNCSSQAAKGVWFAAGWSWLSSLLHFASRIRLLSRVEISIRRSCVMAWPNWNGSIRLGLPTSNMGMHSSISYANDAVGSLRITVASRSLATMQMVSARLLSRVAVPALSLCLAYL